MDTTKKKAAASSAERDVISARVDLELKREFEREAPLRGHSPSQAVELALKLGLPRYLKKYSKQFERISEAA